MTKSATITAYPLVDPVSAKPTVSRVLDHLRQPAYFETALALYRRLQFGRFLDSSYLFTNLPLDSPVPSDSLDGPWFYAFVDRGCRPETEVWIFGNWEIETNHPVVPSSNGTEEQSHSNGTGTSTTKDAQIHTLLLDLLASIETLPTPPSIHTDKDILTAQSQIATSDIHSVKPASALSLPDPNILLWGAVHATTTAHLQTLNLAATHILPVMPNHTFIFPLSALPASTSTTLPPTVRWGKLQTEHFPLVRSRTEIPRQDFTLARLPNLAVFPVGPADAAPVAWAFVGLDGSLTTLHTEASHRRLGLAMMLTTKLFREEMGVFWEEGVEKLAHGNVAVGNEASATMCRRLGGQDIGEAFWVRVDMNARSR